MTQRRVRLGEWRTLGGVGVSAFLVAGHGFSREVQIEWDIEPRDLGDEDLAYYPAVIRPQLVQRVQEYLERPGRAVVVEL